MINFALKLNIGDQRAEVDQKFLKRHFLTTPVFEMVDDADPAIILGRKGSGKSALRLHLSNEIADRNQFFADLSPTENEFRKFFEHILHDRASPLALEYTTKIWELAVLCKLVDLISKAIPSKNYAANFFQKSGIDEKSISEFKKPLSNAIDYILNNDIDEDGIYILTKNIRSFLAKAMKSTGNHFYILIDSVDDTIHQDLDTNKRNDTFKIFFSGLLNFFRFFTDPTQNELCDYLTVKLFIPMDIFNWSVERHADQLRQYKHIIKWDRSELAEFMFNRLIENVDEKSKREIFRNKTNEESVAYLWKSVFPHNFNVEYFTNYGVEIANKSTLDLFLDLTLRRPRDLMEIIRLVAKSSREKRLQSPTKEIIKNSLEEYSNNLKQSVIEEYRSILPQIEEILAGFTGNSPRISKAALVNIIAKSTENEDEENIKKYCSILYECCVLGLPNGQKDHSVSRGTYYYDQNDFSTVWQNKEFQIHPAFWNSLGLTKLSNIK